MVNIEIANIDIRNSLENEEFLEKYNIKYKESLFVKYLKEQTNITVEQIEIFKNKYSFASPISISNMSINTKAFKDNKDNYGLFNNYLKTLKFDKYAIVEIAFALLVYYQGSEIKLHYETIRDILENAYIKYIMPEFKQRDAYPIMYEAYLEAIDNGVIANKIRIIDGQNGKLIFAKINQKEAKKKLEEYAKIYGTSKVANIKRLIK